MMKAIEQLNVLKTISSANRISSIDIFRSIAIISVVLFHFNGTLPMGFLGVDLFFVISGFLIGGILTKEYNNGKSINFFKFIIERGFKVWPSYYAFFLIGMFIAYFFYNSLAPGEIIPFWDIKRYLFFYQNYSGVPYHWSFDHVWSLCVEEHFYILLPLIFIIAQVIFKKKTFLFTIITLMIVTGIASKILMLLYTNSKDTYSATNNRIDALAWGVLLNFVIVYSGDALKLVKRSYIFFIAGVILLTLAIYLEVQLNWLFYHKVIFHSFVPFCFVLMIGGIYYYDFSKLKTLRIIAYYSYNWYLWHPIFVKYILFHLGYNILGLVTYLTISFLFAMIFTIFVEEKFLAKRKFTLNRLFKNANTIAT